MQQRKSIALFCVYLMISLTFLFPDAVAQGQGQDDTPPSFTVSLPPFTPSSTITVQGRTEPHAQVFLQVNPSSPTSDTNFDEQTTASDQGDFVFSNVRLNSGLNTIELFAKDAAGNTNAITLQTTVDTSKPSVEISQIPTLLNDTEFSLTGKTNKEVTAVYTITVDAVDGPETSSSPPVNLTAGQNFAFAPALQPDKENQFVITFTDRAGNTAEFRQTIFVDVSRPEFLAHNLDSLDPTYVQEVTIRGQVNEPGIDVFAFVNGENKATGSYSTSLLDTLKQIGKISTGNADYHDVADSNGNFEITVFLTQELSEEQRQRDLDRVPSQSPFPGGGFQEREFATRQQDQGRRVQPPFSQQPPEQEFDNAIKLVAVDRVGNTAMAEGQIRFTKCGFGSDWNVEVSDISPVVITPELLRLGIAQFSFVHSYQFQGFSESSAIMRTPPYIRLYEINDEIRKNSAIDPLRLVGSSNIQTYCGEDNLDCYTVVGLNAYNYSQPKLKDLDYKDLTIRIPLQLEINYEKDEFGRRIQATQRQCWDTKLLLDVEVPLDTIPEELLETSIDVIDQATELIDQLLRPLKMVAVATFVAYWATFFALQFYIKPREILTCGITRFLEGKKGENSEACKDAKERTIKVERFWRLLGDRSFCPAVPTVSYFMRTHEYDACRIFSINDYADGYNPEQTRKDAKEFFKDKRLEDVFRPDSDKIPSYVADSYNQVFGGGFNPDDYTTKQNVCMADYFEQWDSACLMMNELEQSKCTELNVDCPKKFKGFLNRWSGFCQRQAGRNETGVCTGGRLGSGEGCYYKDADGNWYLAEEVREAQLRGKQVVSVGEVNYNVGFADTNQKNGVIGIHQGYAYESPFYKEQGKLKKHDAMFYTPKDCNKLSPEQQAQLCPTWEGKQLFAWRNASDVFVDSSDHTYIRINNELDYSGIIVYKADGKTYVQQQGALYEQKPGGGWQQVVKAPEDMSRASQDYRQLFGDAPPPRLSYVPASLNDPTYYHEWHPGKYLVDLDGNTIDHDQLFPPGARTPARSDLGVTPPDQVARDYDPALNYVAEPASSFLRAIQCVCFPAITGYLQLWRNILEQIKLCFETILLTGQGKTGLCRAVLTVYVCDLIIDAVKCIAKRYGPSSQRQPRNPTGKLFAAFSASGESLQRDIRNRYGSSNLYHTMFTEKKVIHQACLFAFTGDFDIDVEGLLTTGVGVPLRSEGFLYPHNRRFVSYNPFDGAATFIYHVGVGLVAGSEIQYDVQLVCSNDVSCDPKEGFAQGKCDCYGRDPVYRPITANFQSLGAPGSLPGTLAAGEILGGNEGDLYVYVGDPVRYDKVILQWQYADGNEIKREKIEKRITQIGDRPPEECSFDLAAGFFRCRTIVGRKGTVRFLDEPRAVKEYFFKHEPIRLQFTLEKQSPGYDPKNPSTTTRQIPKYLCWEIQSKDKRAGTYVVVPGKCYDLINDGTYTETDAPFNDNLPGYRIEESDFQRGSLVLRDTQLYAIKHLLPYLGAPAPEAHCRTPEDLFGNNYLGTTGRGSFVFGDAADDVQEPVEIESGVPAQNLSIVFTDTDKFQIYRVRDLGDFGGSQNKGQYCIPDGAAPLSGQKPLELRENGITIDGRTTIWLKDGATFKQGDALVLVHTGTTSTSQNTGFGLECSDFDKRQLAADWVVNIKLLNAKKRDDKQELSLHNAVRDDANIASDRGKKLEFDVPIKAVCQDATTEDQENCPKNELLFEDCFCEGAGTSGRKELCPRDQYCIVDASIHSGNPLCVEYVSCPSNPNEQLDASNTANNAPGWCDCNGDQKMEACGVAPYGYCVWPYVKTYGTLVDQSTGCSQQSKSDVLNIIRSRQTTQVSTSP